MVSARTVDLGHTASEGARNVLIASTYCRSQRFFQHVLLSRDWVVPVLVDLLALRGSWTIVLARTQWAIGTRE